MDDLWGLRASGLFDPAVVASEVGEVPVLEVGHGEISAVDTGFHDSVARLVIDGQQVAGESGKPVEHFPNGDVVDRLGFFGESPS